MASGHLLRKSHDLPVNRQRRLLHRGHGAAPQHGGARPPAEGLARLGAAAPAPPRSPPPVPPASPGGTRQPVTPCSTVSTGPPRSEAITGRPIACASITTRPNASGSRGGVHDDVRQHQRRRHVVALADQAQPVGNAERLGLTDQPLGVAAAALVRPDQHAAHVAPGHARERLDQHRLPLPARSAAPAAARPSAPSGSRHACASRAIRSPDDRVRIEHRRIDAARNDPDARRIGPVARHDQLGDEAAGRDHPLALRHHRVVAALERQVLAVGRRGRW